MLSTLPILARIFGRKCKVLKNGELKCWLFIWVVNKWMFVGSKDHTWIVNKCACLLIEISYCLRAMFVHCKISKVFCINGQLHAFKVLLKLFLIVFQVTPITKWSKYHHIPLLLFFWSIVCVKMCNFTPHHETKPDVMIIEKNHSKLLPPLNCTLKKHPSKLMHQRN